MRLYELSGKDQRAYLLCKLIDIYSELEPTGGTLHVILEDGNYDVDCTYLAEEADDIIALEIMKLLKEFTPQEIEYILETGNWTIVGKVEFGEAVDWNCEHKLNNND